MPPSAKWHTNPILWIEADKTNKNWLLLQRPLRDRKLTSARSSTAIVLPTLQIWWSGPVDVKIIALTEVIFKMKKLNKKQKQKP